MRLMTYKKTHEYGLDCECVLTELVKYSITEYSFANSQ